MALELQLSTDKAQAAVDKIERSLDSLRVSLDRVATGSTNFDAFISRLSGVKGINPAAGQSIRDLGDAAKNLAGAAGNLGNLSNALGKLANLNVTAVATSVRLLVSSLNSVRIPPGLSNLARDLGAVASAAQSAAGGLRAFGAASANIRAPNFSNYSAGFNNVGQAAQRAGSQVSFFGTSATNAKQALTALGIGALGREFGQFISGAFEAQVAFDKFDAIVNNASGPKTAGKAYQFLQAVARETATDINTLTNAFPRFLQALKSAGATAPEISDSFRKVSVAFRGFGLSADEAEGAMKAITQMFQKGKVSAEELRGQLGDRGVPAMNAFAKALNVSVAQLDKMVESGKLGAVEVKKFIDTLFEMSKGAVDAQLQKVNAQLTLMNNAFINLKLAFGDGFFAGVIPGFQALTAAMSTPAVLQFANAIGTVTGLIGGLFMTVLANAAVALSVMTAPLIQIATYIYQIGAAIVATPLGQFVAEMFTLANGTSILGAALYVLVGAITIGVTAWAAYRVALIGAAIAQGAFALAMAPVALTLGGIAVAALLAVEGYRALRGETSLLTNTGERLAETFGLVKSKAADLGAEMNFTGSAAEDAGSGLSNAAAASESAKKSMSSLAPVNRQVADAFGDVAVNANAAANAISGANAAAAAGGGSSGGSSGGGGPSSFTGKFGDYAAGLSTAGGAGESYTSLFSRAGGLSTGGFNGQVSKKVPASAFANAPRFQNGGTTQGMIGSLPDGGIPSILHPNEAVVPLDAGGRIPVSQSGGGVNLQPLITAFGKEFDKAHVVLVEIHKEMTAAKEANTQVGVVYKTEMDRHLSPIQLMANNSTKMLAAINSLSTEIRSAVSSGGGGGGGGGSVGSGGGSAGSSSAGGGSTSIFKQFAGRGSGGGNNSINSGDASIFIGSAGRRVGSGGGSTNTDGGDYDIFKGSSARGFASGSPNAFRDVMSGRAVPAAIHQDEAVVPLPDGRRVPVDLRSDGSEMAHRQRPSRNDDSRDMRNRDRTQNGGRGQTNIVMNITTPDVESFRQSRDQITQKMAQQLTRATRNIGQPDDIDDPTVRVSGIKK